MYALLPFQKTLQFLLKLQFGSGSNNPAMITLQHTVLIIILLLIQSLLTFQFASFTLFRRIYIGFAGSVVR